MQVHQIVPGVFKQGSGPHYTVPSLCNALRKHTENVVLHTLLPSTGESSKHKYNFDLREYGAWPFYAERLGISTAMYRGLQAASPAWDIIHNHSIWMMPNIYPGQVLTRIQDPTPFVLSPRGTLSEWALSRSKIRKRVIWMLGQRATLDRVNCFHATSEEECDEIRRLGFKAPVTIIPNGVDIPEMPQFRKPYTATKRLLFLARIHPKKGVDLLLHSWRILQEEFPDWELFIVGPSDHGYENVVQKEAASLRLNRVHFPGPAYGRSKSEMFFSANAYVLPTRSENFAVSVAEALAHGVPAIVTKGAPWAEVETHNAGWWIDINQDALTACLKQVMSMPPEALRMMGENGRQWMIESFSWESVAEKMFSTYQWLINGSTPPKWVVQ